MPTQDTTLIIMAAATRLGLPFKGLGELHQIVGDMILLHHDALTTQEIEAIDAIIAEDEKVEKVCWQPQREYCPCYCECKRK